MNILFLGKIFILLFWGFVGGVRWMGYLGESQGYAQVTSPFELIQNSKSNQGKNHDENHVRKEREGKSGKKREGKIQAVTVTCPRFDCRYHHT